MLGWKLLTVIMETYSGGNFPSGIWHDRITGSKFFECRVIAAPLLCLQDKISVFAAVSLPSDMNIMTRIK